MNINFEILLGYIDRDLMEYNAIKNLIRHNIGEDSREELYEKKRLIEKRIAYFLTIKYMYVREEINKLSDEDLQTFVEYEKSYVTDEEYKEVLNNKNVREELIKFYDSKINIRYKKIFESGSTPEIEKLGELINRNLSYDKLEKSLDEYKSFIIGHTGNNEGEEIFISKNIPESIFNDIFVGKNGYNNSIVASLTLKEDEEGNKLISFENADNKVKALRMFGANAHFALEEVNEDISKTFSYNDIRDIYTLPIESLEEDMPYKISKENERLKKTKDYGRYEQAIRESMMLDVQKRIKEFIDKYFPDAPKETINYFSLKDKTYRVLRELKGLDSKIRSLSEYYSNIQGVATFEEFSYLTTHLLKDKALAMCNDDKEILDYLLSTEEKEAFEDAFLKYSENFITKRSKTPTKE